LFYLIQIDRNNGAYGTNRPYTIQLTGTNSPAKTVTGNLQVLDNGGPVMGLVSQNSNHVNSITASNYSPHIGETFTITVESDTSAPTFREVNLPIQYNPAVIQPIGLAVTYDSTSSSNIRLLDPDATVFTSVWTFRAVGYGSTTVTPFIYDVRGKSNTWLYNGDYGHCIDIEVSPDIELVVDKSPKEATLYPGDTITYTITAENTGTDDANNVYVTDEIPEGMEFVSSSQGSYDAGTNTWRWNIGTLDGGETQTATITLRVTQIKEGDIQNTACIYMGETEEHCSIAIVHVKPRVNLEVSKEPSYSTHKTGDVFNFTIKVRNNGPSVANNVLVTDEILAGLQYISSSVNVGTTAFDPDHSTWTWTISSLDPNEEQTATITVKVTQVGAGTIYNTVTAISDEMADPVHDNAVVNVQPQADLAITKTVSNPTPYLHEKITSTLIVQNKGPDTASNVYVVDKLPDGLKYISSSANYGSYDPNTGIWTIGDLPNGAVAVLKIVTAVEKVGPIENHAHVYSSTYDPILNNQNDTATINVRANQANAATVRMQKTGLPVAYLIAAMLMVLAGVLIPKRK